MAARRRSAGHPKSQGVCCFGAWDVVAPDAARSGRMDSMEHAFRPANGGGQAEAESAFVMQLSKTPEGYAATHCTQCVPATRRRRRRHGRKSAVVISTLVVGVIAGGRIDQIPVTINAARPLYELER